MVDYVGFTVLVPRAHLPSDILSLEEAHYSRLMEAAHAVGQVLKRTFGARQIGMIFEGFAIDYAHVKLISIRDPPNTLGSPPTKAMVHQAELHEVYPGYVTSLQGPVMRDTVALSRGADSIRKLLQRGKPTAPKSWMSPTNHSLDVLPKECGTVPVVHGYEGCEAAAHDGMGNGDREVSGMGPGT